MKKDLETGLKLVSGGGLDSDFEQSFMEVKSHYFIISLQKIRSLQNKYSCLKLPTIEAKSRVRQVQISL